MSGSAESDIALGVWIGVFLMLALICLICVALCIKIYTEVVKEHNAKRPSKGTPTPGELSRAQFEADLHAALSTDIRDVEGEEGL